MNISAQDRPRYDGWGPDNPWGCEDWIAWHRALAKHHGVELADQIWASAWLDGLSRAAGGRGVARGSGAIFDAVPVGCRTIDSAFASYVAARPVLRNVVWSGIAGAVTAPIAGAASLVRGAGFGMHGTGDALANRPKSSAALIVGGLLIAAWLMRRR